MGFQFPGADGANQPVGFADWGSMPGEGLTFHGIFFHHLTADLFASQGRGNLMDWIMPDFPYQFHMRNR